MFFLLPKFCAKFLKKESPTSLKSKVKISSGFGGVYICEIGKNKLQGFSKLVERERDKLLYPFSVMLVFSIDFV